MQARRDYSTEEHYVLYAAATSMDLRELLWTWEPWRPTYDLPKMLVNVPQLAEAIVELAHLGLIEVFARPSGSVGEWGLVSSSDVAAVVCDADNWWNEDGTPLLIELGITEAAGMVAFPLPDGSSNDERDRRAVEQIRGYPLNED